MIGFYKKNISYLSETAVAPDRRRYAVKEEAARHYIDLDSYGETPTIKIPRQWKDAVELFGEDSLNAKGIVPWHIVRMYLRLKEAFLLGDPGLILKMSSELGHYVADAHVPLHTTKNYDGQLTGQAGLHALWESRLPELFFDQYKFFVGKAEYLPNVSNSVWDAVEQTHLAVDSVIHLEKKLAEHTGNKKYGFETRGKQTAKVVSRSYAAEYHEALNGMVERQMRASVKMIGDLWYTAWVDAGQPDLKKLIDYEPTPEELRNRKKELDEWKSNRLKARPHDNEETH